MSILLDRTYTVQYHGTSGRWYYHVDGLKTTLPEAVLLIRRLENDGYGARLFPSIFTPPDTFAWTKPDAPDGVQTSVAAEEWTVEERLAREG